MPLLSLLTSSTARLQAKTHARLEQYSKPSLDFFLLIAIAAAIAALGLLLDNAAIVIGAMVVAPLITPIFGFSLSLLSLRIRRLTLALLSILLGTLCAIVTAFLVGLFAIAVDPTYATVTTEILARAKPDILFFFVAFLSGIAGAYAYSRPKISEAIAGIAISVAVIPPLGVVGLALAQQTWELASQSFLLYLFNLLGITFGSIILFVIIGFGKDAA